MIWNKPKYGRYVRIGQEILVGFWPDLAAEDARIADICANLNKYTTKPCAKDQREKLAGFLCGTFTQEEAESVVYLCGGTIERVTRFDPDNFWSAAFGCLTLEPVGVRPFSFQTLDFDVRIYVDITERMMKA